MSEVSLQRPVACLSEVTESSNNTPSSFMDSLYAARGHA